MNAQFEPDILTVLKTKVDVYEKELRSSVYRTTNMVKEGELKTKSDEFVKATTQLYEQITKTLDAYREYVKELEKYVPR